MPQSNPPLVVIVGQTASGKTALAIELAKRFNGEVIAADSRTVYKGMDIGTAKPTPKERSAVPHHLLDVVAPGQSFTVAEFQKLARKAIDDIAARGKVPFLVGGSGLYVDAVIYEFSLRKPADPQERMRLDAMTIDELQAELERKGIPFPANAKNPRHLVRSIETNGEPSAAEPLRSNTLVIGLSLDQDVLKDKIKRRIATMFDQGFIAEVQNLIRLYGVDVRAFQTPGYKEVYLYLKGQMSLDEAKRQFIRAHMQYARRQKSWFKRDKDIHWISNPEESVDLVTTFLNK